MVWTGFTGPRLPGGQLLAMLWTRYAPALVASVLLLPIVRLRGALRRAAQAGELPPIQFRKNDFRHELAAELTLAQERLAVSSHDLAEYPAEEVPVFPVVEDDPGFDEEASEPLEIVSM